MCLKGRAPIGNGDWELLKTLVSYQTHTYIIDEQVECHIFKGLVYHGKGTPIRPPKFPKGNIILDLGGDCEFAKVASLIYYSGDGWFLKVYDTESIKVDGKKLPTASLITIPISKPSFLEVEGTESLWKLDPQYLYEEVF